MSDWTGWIDAVIEALPTDRDTDAPAAMIPARLFRLWLVLARYSDNKTGKSWPSLTTLARRTGCDRRNLARALAEGEERGLWSRDRAGGGTRDTTRYTVHRIPTSVNNATSGSGATSGNSATRTSGKSRTRLVVKTPHRTNPFTHPFNTPTTEAPKRKRPATKKPRTPRQPDPLWDTVAALWFGGTVARPHATRAGKLVRDLRDLGATPDEVRLRHERYRTTWPKATASGEALIKHWHNFSEPLGALDMPLVEPTNEDLGL